MSAKEDIADGLQRVSRALGHANTRSQAVQWMYDADTLLMAARAEILRLREQTPTPPVRAAMTISVHPDTLKRSMSDWLANEIARQLR